MSTLEHVTRSASTSRRASWRAAYAIVALAATALAGCDGFVPAPAPGPDFEYTTVRNVDVLHVDGLVGALSYGLVTHRPNDERTDWRVVDGDTLRERLDYGIGVPVPLAAQDGSGNLWSVHREGDRLMMCQRVAVLQGLTRCFQPELRTGSEPRALVADGEGDVVLLARTNTTPVRWQTLWMRAGLEPTEQVIDLELLPEGASPVLLHGTQGARLVWPHEGTLQVAALREGAAWRWESEAVIAPTGFDSRTWAAASEGGIRRRLWLVTCATGVPPVAWRLAAGGWQALPVPPLPDCAGIVGRLNLASSGNGDAMLLWAERPAPDAAAVWRSSRWIEQEGRWTAREDLGGLFGFDQALAADDAGRFVWLNDNQQSSLLLRRLLVSVQRPGETWQPALDLGAYAGGAAVAAGGDGHALVAWTEPTSEADSSATRLATRRLDLSDHRLPLEVAVGGGGRVRSSPEGLDCPGRCSADFTAGSAIQLVAEPAAGQRLRGWEGDCTGSAATITVTLDAPVACRAAFEPNGQQVASLTLVAQGGGRVAADPPGLVYAPGTVVLLTATPDTGRRFVGWTGDADCLDGSLTMDADRACTGVFEADPAVAQLTVQVSGNGRVTSAPAGIDCGSACSTSFAAGTSVTLVAAPDIGYGVGWTGAAGCSGSALTVSLTLASGSNACIANFTRLAPVNEWRMLGGAPADAAVVDTPAIAVDGGGVPTIAYAVDVAELRQVVVARLTGQAWLPIGGQAVPGGLNNAYAPSLALTADGQPVVAWFDSAARIQVRRWDGSTWRVLSNGLAVTPGSVTNQPHIAIHGTTLVAAWNEFQGTTARLALQRYDLATDGPWTGGYVDGVSSSRELDLRLSLDGTGMATLLYGRKTTSGELPLRAVQETAGGWSALCADLGTGTGLDGPRSILGWGLQHAPDGSAIAVEADSDYATVRAWRCDGTTWAHWGADDGRVLAVDNVQLYLEGVAVSPSGAPMLAVQVNTGYTLGTRVHAFVAGAGGFVPAGPPLEVALPGRTNAIAVAPAAAGSPAVVFGVQQGPNQGLRSYRFHP
ncbi:MAG: hypothetical protein KF788_11740 [Piscinibacter sp.]|nr:hypothetical protein [Piscinibacter sp.]